MGSKVVNGCAGSIAGKSTRASSVQVASSQTRSILLPSSRATVECTPMFKLPASSRMLRTASRVAVERIPMELTGYQYSVQVRVVPAAS